MIRFFSTAFPRTFLALAVALGLILPMAAAAQAAATPSISVVWVKSDSVRIRAYDFPAEHMFNVLMDKYGSQAVGGTVLAVTNSGAGGSFEETYPIPDALKNEPRLAIRLNTNDGYAAASWFWTSGNVPSATPTPVSGASTAPGLQVVAVRMNSAITFRTYKLPSYQNFTVRIGPFNNFAHGSVVVGTFNSGAGGALTITVPLPDTLHNVSLAAIRLDSDQGRTVYNSFTNAPLGNVNNENNNIEINPGGSVAQSGCEIISVSPDGALGKYDEFDAVWVIKNTSYYSWAASAVDYQYESGAALQKYYALYDLTKTVAPDHQVTIRVDMVAPKYAGSYTTTWSLRQGSTTLCRMPITITVK
jgi:hypothetical protein